MEKQLDKGNEFARAAVLMLRTAVHKINESMNDRRDYWLSKSVPDDDLRRYNHIDLSRLSAGGY